MIDLNILNIVEATGGRLNMPSGTGEDMCNRQLSCITVDSREAGEGSLFIALKGERSDGHDYIPQIADRIACAVVEHEVGVNVPQIIVPSTYSAVGAIGAYIRKKSGVKVIGVTGSVGKTSVKELTACVLSRKYKLLKTEGNFNNELGLPRTLFRLDNSHEVAVLEMGISHFGEMTRLSAIAAPDMAIFTNIENVHTENLGDRDGVLIAKTELVANMRGYTLILNGDDDKLSAYRPPMDKRAVYYGFSDNCSVTARCVVPHGLEYTEFELCTPLGSTNIMLPAAGMHMVLNSLAAAACGLEMGVRLDDIKSGLESYEPVGSRMRRFSFNGAVVIDDCYNASPTSMEAGLKVLCAENGRRIAVLGDMLELGSRSHELHEQIGRIAAEQGLDMLITVGDEAAFIASAALQNGVKAVKRASLDEAGELLRCTLMAGDTVLIKASHGMHFEKIVERLK